VPTRDGFEDLTRHSQVNRLAAASGVIQQEHFDPAAALLAAQQACLDHRRVVHHQHIARGQAVRQRIEPPVPYRAGGTIEGQQP
jgi:hypothetical protein